MGNYRFKLSDMIPNAWFYKLKDMGKTGKKQTPSRKKKQLSSSQASTTTQSSKPKPPHQQCTPRKSYYFTRDLKSNKLSTTPHPNSPELPRKSSSKQRIKTKTPTRSTCSSKLVSSTVSAGCSCRTTVESVWTKSDSPPEYSSSPFDSSAESESPDPEFRTDRVLPTKSSFDEMVSLSTSCACKTVTRNSNTTNDVVIDVDKNSLPRKDDKLNGYEDDAVSELDLVLELPPILTKPPKIPNNKSRTRVVKHEEVKEKEQRNGVRRFSVSSPGVKLRVNSPRISGRRVVSHGRKSVSLSSSSTSRRSLSDSFAVVKSSFNPQKDFRESMVEMIVENNIRASKDLEDLLACYLSLNSDEYHDLIIKVFKQIWFDLTETR